MEPDSINNISSKYFDKTYNLKQKSGKSVANVFHSKSENSKGVVYTIHGFGGSPIEPCLYNITEIARKNNFDVIAIETNCLSATDGIPKNNADMTLEHHKYALLKALLFCRKNKEFKSNNNIVFAHSMGARAISDLALAGNFVKNYFNKFYLLNPYFITPEKVAKIKNSPMWSRLNGKIQLEKKNFGGSEYKIEKSLSNYIVDIKENPVFKNGQDISEMAMLASHRWTEKPVTFILGAQDLPSYCNFNTNKMVAENFLSKNKDIVIIPEADHSFENKLSEYRDVLNNLFQKIR